MKKLKGLLPTQRERKRYVSFRIKSQKQHSSQNVSNAIESELKKFLGTYGYANAGINIVEMTNKEGIIKVNANFIPETITGLSLINQINQIPTHIETVKTSGILAKTKKSLKRRAQ